MNTCAEKAQISDLDWEELVREGFPEEEAFELRAEELGQGRGMYEPNRDPGDEGRRVSLRRRRKSS